MKDEDEIKFNTHKLDFDYNDKKKFEESKKQMTVFSL